jgi:hypothetical protein
MTIYTLDISDFDSRTLYRHAITNYIVIMINVQLDNLISYLVKQIKLRLDELYFKKYN